MKYLPLLLLLAASRCVVAQGPTLKADESIPIPKVTFDDKATSCSGLHLVHL